MQAVEQAEVIAHALRRSLVYRFLSTAMRPPDESLLAIDPAQWQTVAQAARSASQDAAAALEALGRACAETGGDALRAEYYRVFGHRVGGDCPLYEAQYVPGGIFPQAQCLADVAGFYRAFGLQVGDAVRERPDHISLELEFMHVLAYREAYARQHHGPDHVALLADAQRAFLRDHLGRWVPALSRLVGNTAGDPYRALAAALAAWVAADAAAVGASPLGDPDLLPSPDAELPDAAHPVCGADGCPIAPPP
ncbi:MAG: molecular chaperone TorD family protein [Armatimonadota bacterium]|nr:molecular chaperone TorD family protein [Armatimonadota bacterium]